MDAPPLPSLPNVSHRMVRVNGIDLHLAEAGSGPPVVLLHGWPQHWWCWRELVAPLARNYRVLAPDLRGFGWSDAPPGDYSKATWAGDVLALLDGEGLDRVALIGHDWGGYSAFLLALDHPDRVERLMALDIAPPWRHAIRPRIGALALPVLGSYQAVLATPILGPRALTTSGHFVRAVIRSASGPRKRWSDRELDAYSDVLMQPARARASAACYRTFLTRELAQAALRGDRTRDLHVPALLALGANSPLRRTFVPRQRQGLRVMTIPSAGHFLPEEAPGEVLKLAEGWLAESSSSPI